MQYKKSAALLLAILASLGSLLSFPANAAAQQSSSNQPVYGGTLTMDFQADPPHMDPAKAYDLLSLDLVSQMYDELVAYQGKTNNLIPNLASWTISDGGKLYTFHIRKAKFWNGDPVTAQSFVTAFDRVLQNQTQSPGQGFIDPLIEGSAAYVAGKAKTVSGLKALNSNTFQITLTHQSATFLYVVAMPFFPASDTNYIAKHSMEYYDKHPMGTGPFELASYVPGQVIILKRNPHYFLPKLPYLNQVVMNIDSSPISVLLHFEQGDTGLISWNQSAGIPSQDYLPLQASPTFRKDIRLQTEVAVNYLGLNTKYGPTSNVNVRRALEYAINKKQIVRIMGGLAIPANQIIPPSMPSGYEQQLPADATYSYNPTLAKKLLAKAGYPNGFSTTIYTDTTSHLNFLTAQAIQQMLARVGVHAQVNGTDIQTFLNSNETGKQTIFIENWVEDFADPSDFLNTLFNSANIPAIDSTNYSNSTVDALLNKGALMPAGVARDAVYKEAQNIILSQAPWVPTVYPVYAAAVAPWVKGFYINPAIEDPLAHMWVVSH